MPLTIKQLNADTTFLLTFSSRTRPSSTSPSTKNDDFSILIDPWLTGDSPIFHACFAVSRHTTQSSIQSLAELNKLPDLIIISQPKNDHCNKETLCTLPKTWDGKIVAVPAATKKIRSWRHFAEEQIHVLAAYSPKNADTVFRLPLGSSQIGQEGGSVITIANIPTPLDLSAVHNAIGITCHTARSSPLNVLYTPHGLHPPLLQPYLTHHIDLEQNSVDVLFHSLNTEANPWYLGGVISNGAPKGVQIAKALGVRYWVAAHDEVKENAGVATRLIENRVYGVGEVEGMLREQGTKGCRVVNLHVGGILRIGEDEEKDKLHDSGEQNENENEKVAPGAAENGHG